MDPKTLPEELVGERITLRRQRVEFLDDMYQAINDSRQHLSQFLEWAKTQSEDDTLQFLAGCQVSWEDHSKFTYAIFETGTNKLIGGCDAIKTDWENDSAEIGYWLAENACGKGCITDAVNTLGNALFIIGLNRIVIKCNVENEASASVAKRCGYIFEGTKREDTLLEDGTYRSTHIFSKLKREWEAT